MCERILDRRTNPPEYAETYLRVCIAVGLSRHPRVPGRGQPDVTNLLERLRDRAEGYLRFTRDLRVAPTKDQGERDLRPVTQIRISGCQQSETGTANWLAVRSYLSTAAKH